MPNEPVDVVRLRDATGEGHHHTEPRCLTCHPLTREELAALADPSARFIVLGERLDALEAKLDALETLVREIKHALSAGAVGKWS